MSRSLLTQLFRSVAVREGTHSTAIEGVSLMRVSRSLPRMPVLYEPGIVIVGQGRKRGFLGDQIYTYDPHNYLVLSVPLPFDCETEASLEEPLLAISIRVNLTMLAELLLQMDDPSAKRRDQPDLQPSGIYSTTLDEKLTDTTIRLLKCLADPMETRILGPQIVRELIFRVLCGEQGYALRAAAALHSRFAQVNRALQRIHSDYAHDLTVDDLAAITGMSASNFHQSFRAVTSTSPMQYVKQIRLHKARLLMAQDGLRASAAAVSVGYESASQFSREFKRMFGMSPVEETVRTRQLLGLPSLSARPEAADEESDTRIAAGSLCRVVPQEKQ